MIKKYFPELSQQKIDLLSDYEQLLKDWNTKINLISRKNEEHIVEQHILHSLAIAKLTAFHPQATVLDLGTGGGLPGIPLAILYPDVRFHLVDSIGKKIDAVTDMAHQLNMQNVSTEKVRVEKHTGRYHFVITRAVAKTKQMIAWTRKIYKKENLHQLPNGLIALKGGDLSNELAKVSRPTEVFPINDFFEEEFFVTKKIVYVQMVHAGSA